VNAAPRRRPAPGHSRVRALILIGLLTAALIVWAALPGQSGTGPRLALICAGLAGLAGLAQLALVGIWLTVDPVSSLPERSLARLGLSLQAIPWAEVVIVAVLLLEVQHPARAWHTGLLGVALLGYLFAVHLTETGAPARVLRPQLPLLAAGVALLALAVGAAAVPTPPSGPPSTVVRVIAVAAAVVAGVLVVPVVLRGRREL
jgi:hypothetical protein